MNETRFEQLLLDRFDKIDNRLDKMDNQMTALENKMDDRMTALENKMDDRMTALENRFGNVEQTTAWIKGKLEARHEFSTDIKSWIAIAVAIAAVIFAWLK